MIDFTLLSLNTPVAMINEAVRNSLVGNIGIEISAISEGFVEGFLVLSEKNCRPGGILHGGANLVLAETIAGLGSMLLVDMKNFDVLGTQVSGNHTGILVKGKATGEAKIIHRGNKTHVWNVDVRNEEGKLLSTIRVTNMIVKRNE